MPTWKVLIDYSSDVLLDKQDAIDQELDTMAESAGEILDAGSGSGFGRRDLDYLYGTEEEAARLVEVAQAYFGDNPGLDLTVRYVALEEDLD